MWFICKIDFDLKIISIQNVLVTNINKMVIRFIHYWEAEQSKIITNKYPILQTFEIISYHKRSLSIIYKPNYHI